MEASVLECCSNLKQRFSSQCGWNIKALQSTFPTAQPIIPFCSSISAHNTSFRGYFSALKSSPTEDIIQHFVTGCKALPADLHLQGQCSFHLVISTIWQFWRTCSIQSSVPWYRAPPLWFIMRVRTTSTGLEAKAPASPHTKLDLRGEKIHIQIICRFFIFGPFFKTMVTKQSVL